MDNESSLNYVYTQENKNFKIAEDVGTKKAQKQEMIQDARRFGVIYTFLHSTSKYTYVVLWSEDLAAMYVYVFAGGM